MSQIIMPNDIKNYMFAGKARFTLVSKLTEKRFTFRFKRSKDEKVVFVSVMTGCDNDSHYSYIGFISSDNSQKLIQTSKSKLSCDDQRVKTITWYLENIGHLLVEFHHDGKCGKCRRSLTVPESVKSGIGPICAGK